MTAYQATRSRAAALPARRRLSSPVRAGRRAQAPPRVLAGVLVCFLLGLIYLAQTVQLAATNYEVERLLTERDDLIRQVRTVEASLVRWAAEPLVVERAQQRGFDPLGARVRIPAR